MSNMYLRDSFQEEYEKNINNKINEILLDLKEATKNTVLNNEKVIIVFINMSCQSNGILDFKKNNYLIDKPVQLYLHRLDIIEKFLEPIILTKEKLEQITFILSHSRLEGYTKYSFLETWIIKNDIKNFKIFD